MNSCLKPRKKIIEYRKKQFYRKKNQTKCASGRNWILRLVDEKNSSGPSKIKGKHSQDLWSQLGKKNNYFWFIDATLATNIESNF